MDMYVPADDKCKQVAGDHVVGDWLSWSTSSLERTFKLNIF